MRVYMPFNQQRRLFSEEPLYSYFYKITSSKKLFHELQKIKFPK
jgi:hypothetical protein